MFAKIAVRENRIPFNISGDPFWSEENQTRLKESIRQIEEGKFSEHELIEVSRCGKTGLKWLGRIICPFCLTRDF